VFVQDVYAGAAEKYRLPVRIVTEHAWHSHFVRNMFILPHSLEEYKRFVPEFTIMVMPSFKANPSVDNTVSETFICLSFEKKIAIVGNTAYAGEIKKSVFTILNYLLPLEGVLSMHCSANVNPDDPDDVALFFGLSGTGKTTLSADPTRRLIGDDEHGWSDDGVFNFEGGCYAKVIGLSASAEPEIFATTKRFGTILENVPFDPVTRFIDLDDDSVTENTRASYPLEFIANAVPEKQAGHPKNIILLTCDASGVIPPIARLSPNQTLYQFISGYTSKIAGTEVGLGSEPEITFSTCFGGPFMVHHPYFYADLLRRKIERYGVGCWLVNTGWVGGPYGVGKRISIKYTRALLNAALTGKLAQVEYYKDPIFGFEVPKSCPEVPDTVLQPWSSWPSREEYDKRYKDLALRFKQNFKKFEEGTPAEVVDAGPII
jgi:phosphoenolpyruvate carboxykinase (ATP)